MRNQQTTKETLFTYLRVLAAGADSRQFFDLRYLTPKGYMRQQFVSVLRIQQAARRITGLARQTDVYIGVALRDRAHGGKDAISGSRLLYIECDTPNAQEYVASFAHVPSMIVASGSSGHLHVYWCLEDRAGPVEVESANRRLALALHGDPASVDIARILRPPSTLNYKHHPPAPVVLLEHNPGARYALHELTSRLPPDLQPERAMPRTLGQPTRTVLDRELLAIPAAEYVRVLAGLEPNSAGKVLCPFHCEDTPSLQLYPDGTFYCYGRACKKGGTIFDFAAAIWLTGTRGRDFLELRRRLAAAFAFTSTPTKGIR
jgi:hypothetical protein